ncbi:CPBP family intramembrane glutamic endopeptidase [Fonticella tunisiensis]|uniref:CAAX prenyl protease 2/Lysostaphin resistance protein A-like domain-containing protein n=1 Tax=Fonticella tunisiensis TaxID=1096341 RepID=A0A4R7KA40_9CLOT|nr:CPBP family intramembrane glutamic endopeptidase [Fonticella tunisiensis]TDT51224.1 hypothetical protein EDD71_1205 [Fonticella tunisiensis]
MKKYVLKPLKLLAFLTLFTLAEFLAQPIVQLSADIINNDYLTDLIKIILETLAAVLIVKVFLWKKSFREIGLYLKVNKNILYMAIGGLISGLAGILIILAAGGFTFDRFIWNKLFLEDIIPALIMGILHSMGIAITEGIVIRGYVYKLLDLKNIYLGVILASLVYVLINILNILTLGFNILPILGYFLFTVLLSLIFILTGNLMYSIVFHGAWYFANMYIFSPLSAQTYGVIMLNPTDKILLNGGEFGIMGSAVFILIMFIADILLFVKIKGKKN